MIISGQLVDLHNKEIFPAEIIVENGLIQSIKKVEIAPQQYILPGFVDAHIHIESSMLTPYEFAKIALLHGTVATVSDPHEIANVCGVAGVDYMIENAKHAPLKFYFGAPSCVPATTFETAGAVIDVDDIEQLLSRPEIKYLAEMMNFPGVLMKDESILKKIAAAKKHSKPVDGHAPGMRGADVVNYAGAGITTDHECFTLNEALEKIAAGMKILIREGSAAKNFDALISLFDKHPDQLMFCSDDKHPDDLVLGHINQLVSRALHLGYNFFDVLRAACILPVVHYKLDVGLLREGDAADFILVNNLETMQVSATYIQGECVAEQGAVFMENYQSKIINNFSTHVKSENDFKLKANHDEAESVLVRVIEALDGQLITNEIQHQLPVVDRWISNDTRNDILKIVVVNRYNDAPVSIGFVKNIGITKGAFASTVAHDSHNIVAVGVDAISICNVVNALIENRGGISCTDGENTEVFALPIAGLMTDKDGHTAAKNYERLTKMVKGLGCKLHAPFMTLSFLALPVIPSLKLTDKGLFDVNAFNFTDVILQH